MESNNNSVGSGKQTEKVGYSSFSSTLGVSNLRGEWVSTQGEHLVIKDAGKRLEAFVDGKNVGYTSYEEEVEEGVRRLRFGYIIITDTSQRSKKISGALIFCFAMLALEKGLGVVVVGHPDPGLKGYWEHMGFDYTGAQQRQHTRNVEFYPGMEVPPVEETKPTEAIGSAANVLKLSQASFRQYWTHSA